MSLAHLPADVLLLVLNHLHLRDILSFILVCKHFHYLSTSRLLWISALHRTRQSHPIPLPTHTDLKSLPLPRLRAVALHALRLEHNLSHKEPKIIGPTKSLQLDARLDLVFQIPGTELYLFHSRATGCVVCWDIGLGRAVTQPVYAGTRILDVSPGEDLPGMFSMGCLLQKGDGGIWDLLIVIRVTYSDPANIQVDITFSHLFSPSFFHWAVYMNAEIVGVLEIPRTLIPGTTISLVAFNRYTMNRVVIHTDIPYDDRTLEGHSGSSSFCNNIFILIEHSDLSCRYRIPSSLFPYSTNPNCPTTSQINLGEVPCLQWDNPARVHYTQIGPLSADPGYGVPAVSLHRIVDIVQEEMDGVRVLREVGAKMLIRFWTRSDIMNREEKSEVKDEDKGKNKEVVEGSSTDSVPTLEPLCAVIVSGDLWSAPGLTWQLMLLPHSGRQVLLVVKEGEELQLLLVRLRMDRPHNAEWDEQAVSVHRLHTPSFISMDHVYGLSLDDHRGVVTLLDDRDYLFAIPFA